MYRLVSIYPISVMICAVIVTNAFADANHLYFFHWWLDIPMHLVASICVALLAFRIMQISPAFSWKISSSQQSVVFVLLLVMFVGVSWEIYEYFFDVTIVRHHTNYYLFDTAKDLSMDLIGGLTASLFMLTTRYNKRNV